jgi:hypothetical protein
MLRAVTGPGPDAIGRRFAAILSADAAGQGRARNAAAAKE